MSVINRTFNDESIIFPGVYVQRKYDGSVFPTVSLGNVLYLIGTCESGVTAVETDGTDTLPALERVNQIASYSDLSTLGSGVLYDAARLALNASGDGSIKAPSVINCIRVNPALAADVTSTDWDNAFDLMKSLNADLVVALTDDSTIQAAFKSHLEEMNAVDGLNERLGATGAAASFDVDAIIAGAAAVPSPFLTYFGPSFKALNADGEVTTYDGFYGAAMLFALLAASRIDYPLTLKELNVLGFGKSYSLSELSSMIEGRVTVFKESFTGGDYEIQRALTTYAGEDLLESELVCMRIALYISKDSRTQLREKIKGMDSALNNQKINLLKDYITKEMLPAYVDRGLLTYDSENDLEAFRNVEVSVTGDEFTFSFEGTIPAPLNFVFGTYLFSVIGA